MGWLRDMASGHLDALAEAILAYRGRGNGEVPRGDVRVSESEAVLKAEIERLRTRVHDTQRAADKRNAELHRTVVRFQQLHGEAQEWIYANTHWAFPPDAQDKSIDEVIGTRALSVPVLRTLVVDLNESRAEAERLHKALDRRDAKIAELEAENAKLSERPVRVTTHCGCGGGVVKIAFVRKSDLLAAAPEENSDD